jgi:hypothetical protein
MKGLVAKLHLREGMALVPFNSKRLGVGEDCCQGQALLYDAQGHGRDVLGGEMDPDKVMEDPVASQAWL